MWSDIRFEVGVGWLEVTWGCGWCVECNRFNVVSTQGFAIEQYSNNLRTWIQFNKNKFARRSFLSPNRLLYGSGIRPLLYCSITKPRVV